MSLWQGTCQRWDSRKDKATCPRPRAATRGLSLVGIEGDRWWGVGLMSLTLTEAQLRACLPRKLDAFLNTGAIALSWPERVALENIFSSHSSRSLALSLSNSSVAPCKYDVLIMPLLYKWTVGWGWVTHSMRAICVIWLKFPPGDSNFLS